MKRFIITGNRDKIAININSIANFKSYTSSGTYIDYYANDCETNAPFRIDRAESNQSFDDICKYICESSYIK